MNYKKNTNYLNIPSVDAKDLYIANHQEIHKQKKHINGYSLLKNKNGKLVENLTKYINVYDFSLDLIELRN